MKYSFDEKLEAVKLHLKDGTYHYPERCNTKAKKKTYANQVRFWEAQYLLKRDFHADALLRKAGTDVTEMKFGFGKVYFSPIIDFQNDEILAYSVSESPNMKMISDMLEMLYRKFPNTYNMVLHSDQGWQYQMRQYQDSLKAHGIIQSMSRKGNCLDNPKTENLLKKEIE